MDFCVNGATQGAGEAPAIDTKIHLLYTSGKQKSINLCENDANFLLCAKQAKCKDCVAVKTGWV